jgi:two-component system, LytTR family, response regulator
MIITAVIVATDEDIDGSLELKLAGAIVSVPFREILFVESFGNYVKIVTAAKTYLTQITTKTIEGLLPEVHFIRIHKSYIINKHMIEKIEHDAVVVNSIILPIGKTYKQYFFKLIGKEFRD